MKVCKFCMCLKTTRRCTRKPALFRDDKFSWKYFLHLVFFPSRIDLFDCTKDLMENKFRSIWNSSVDRAGRPSLSPYLFVFLLQEGSGACWLRRYLFCLLLQTSWRVLTADGQKWDKPKAAACSCFLANCLYFCQVICFIICCCGTRSYLVFWRIFL